MRLFRHKRFFQREAITDIGFVGYIVATLCRLVGTGFRFVQCYGAGNRSKQRQLEAGFAVGTAGGFVKGDSRS